MCDQQSKILGCCEEVITLSVLINGITQLEIMPNHAKIGDNI
jgi:hypothetical protein